MDIKKILWPTDFSDAAAEALPYVSTLSERFQAEVHLLHVAEDLTSFAHYWGSGPDFKHIRELNDYALKLAEKRLEELCRKELHGCPLYHIHIALGDPAQRILELVEEIGADVVVMAIHGMKAHFPFGSVAERVVKNSPVPVLTVSPTRGRKAKKSSQ
jgi:nucleotide-binding universal stress UspA family protein